MSALGILCLLVALGLLWRGQIVLHENHVQLRPRTKQPKIAVLIAARDESAVIAGLLKSLQAQTVKVKPQDIYVIVESRDDPTVKICQQFGNTVILRKDLTKQRKGYALDEALKQILPRRSYDLYFIFDADNILAKDFLEKMLQSYAAGYEIAMGYRNSKNANANIVAAVSSLTWSMVNMIGNRRRAKSGGNIIFSGTGYYVDGDLVEEWQGWPFKSLTEDYELSLYATLHGLTTQYNEAAMFYDEQPTKYRQTVAQRVRWIKGYFSARHKYVPLMKVRKRGQNIGSIKKECIGVKPAIWAIVGIVLMIAGLIVDLCVVGKVQLAGWLILAILLLVYVVLLSITIVMIRREKMHFKPSMKIKAALVNPFYLVTYIPCAIKALLKKNVTWTKIEHGAEKK